MPDRVLQEFSSVYGERFQWPQPGSPVKLAHDPNFGGVLGFEVNGSLYSSLETLPKEYHVYVVEGGNASKVCRNGHRWSKHGKINEQGKRICRRCHAQSQQRQRDNSPSKTAPQRASRKPL